MGGGREDWNIEKLKEENIERWEDGKIEIMRDGNIEKLKDGKMGNWGVLMVYVYLAAQEL